MPLDSHHDIVTAGPASRKRTYAQITRSLTHSATPPPPSKRRRTLNSPTPPVPRSTRSPIETVPLASRFVGDGLDYRRPTGTAMEQSQPQQDNIDLTLDDDSDEDDDSLFLSNFASLDSARSSRRPTPTHRTLSQHRSTQTSTASRQRPQSQPPEDQPAAPPEVIEIISEDETDDDDDDEIQITGSRPLPRANLPPIREQVPDLNDRSGFLNVPGMPGMLFPSIGASRQLRNAMNHLAMPQFLGIGGHRGRNRPIPPPNEMGLFDRARAILQQRLPAHDQLPNYDIVAADLGGDYDNIDLDYAAAPFEIEDPGADDADVEEVKPRELSTRAGFTRDLEEDADVLVCVACEDELATGEEEIKQQVWVSKRCGHVYCGTCASRRTVCRKGSDRDRKRPKQAKLDDLKQCMVDGCTARLMGKTAMFQIYL